MNHVEVEARYEIDGGYTKKIQIEGRVLGDISTNHSYCYPLPKYVDRKRKRIKDILELILKPSPKQIILIKIFQDISKESILKCLR
jgi:glutamine synthetase